jgi:hypothetical protein
MAVSFRRYYFPRGAGFLGNRQPARDQGDLLRELARRGGVGAHDLEEDFLEPALSLMQPGPDVPRRASESPGDLRVREPFEAEPDRVVVELRLSLQVPERQAEEVAGPHLLERLLGRRDVLERDRLPAAPLLPLVEDHVPRDGEEEGAELPLGGVRVPEELVAADAEEDLLRDVLRVVLVEAVAADELEDRRPVADVDVAAGLPRQRVEGGPERRGEADLAHPVTRRSSPT